MKKTKLQKGLFISFEGGEGVGKSTQIKRLSQALEKMGYSVRCVREPGGAKISESIRKITHDPSNTMMADRAEALLFAASRAQLVAEVYKPLINKGYIVLADRYVDSSYVYQGIARGLGYKEIKELNDFAIDGLMPDLTFLLDMDYKEGQKRRHSTDKVDRMDLQKKSFYEAVHRGYHEIAQNFVHRIKVIDASGDIDAVHGAILGEVITHLK